MKTRILLSIGLLVTICNFHVQAASDPTSTCKALDADISESYSGGCKDGLANGEGIAKGKDEYKGMLVDGKPHGKGTYTWQNGNKYVGDWVNGNQHGKGTSTRNNGDKYEGDWVGGKPHGKGTKTMQDGYKYEGDWFDGKPHGKGTATLANGKVLSGDFVAGKFIVPK